MNQTKLDGSDGNYRMRPDANHEFKVAEVKSIIEDVMQQVLDGKIKHKFLNRFFRKMIVSLIFTYRSRI